MQWTLYVFGTDEFHELGWSLTTGQDTCGYTVGGKGSQHGVFVVELFGDEDALVAGEGHWLREVGAVDIVDRTPGTIHPVSTGLKDVMLEIVLVEKKDILLCSFLSKFVQTAPVPEVWSGEVVA